MTIVAIRKKLHELIDTADNAHVKALYSLFKDQMAEKYDPLEDDAFVKEMDQRVKDFETGKAKGVSWEEVKLKARLQRAAAKNKKVDLMKQAASDPLFLADMKELD